MTWVFLTVVRALLVGLVVYWGYRLWSGTASLSSRCLGMLFCAALTWQITAGTW
jgi:hypothetical protein